MQGGGELTPNAHFCKQGGKGVSKCSLHHDHACGGRGEKKHSFLLDPSHDFWSERQKKIENIVAYLRHQYVPSSYLAF